MQRLVVSALLLTGFIVSMPAAARINPGYGSGEPGRGLGRQIGRLERRVERARDGGLLTRGSARQLKREARQIDRLRDRYGRDGLSDSEARELQTRIHVLKDDINSPRARTSQRRGRRGG